MKVSMPSGSAHGWGIAGEYLAREIIKLPPVDGVTLHCIGGVDLKPLDPQAWDRINIGYTFFEDDIEVLRHTRRAAAEWDHIVAGSSWCEQHLRIGGIRNTSTILQGIDPANFSPSPPRPDDGRFIVFSGGKFESRKSQDIVIAAMKILMARHSDLWLSCAWYNHWPFSMATMQGSRYISYRHLEEDCMGLLRRTLQENGLPMDRIILHPLLDNARMRNVYVDTDMGLFPNRCEGGNNMVMSEYMACGRTAVASDASGQGDIITTENAFPLTSYEPLLISRSGVPSAIWFEPSLEEVVEKLGFALLNRGEIRARSIRAGEDLQRLRWDRAAEQFHGLACKLAGKGRESLTVRVHQASLGEPLTADDYLREGRALLDSGNPALAEARLLKARALNPFSAEVYNCLAGAMDAQERHQQALGYYQKALSLLPDSAVINFNMGNTMKKLERPIEAAAYYREALKTDPDFAEAHYNLGLVLQGQRLFDQALDEYERALALRPAHAGTLHNMGDILQDRGQVEQAVACYDKVLALDPQLANTHNSLGNALLCQGKYPEAIAAYERAMAIDPDNPMIHNNLGAAFKDKGDLDQAIACHRRALALEPGNADAHWNLSLACLMKGAFMEGWQGYEWRWEKSVPVPRRELPLPLWDGEPLGGKKIILVSEQGAGDAFQFVRYAALVAGRGGTVLIECQSAALKPVLERVPMVREAFVAGETLPQADCYFPLMSLPLLFGTTLESIPADVPYLIPDPARLESFQRRMGGDGGLKVGIVWAGRQNLVRNRKRTCGLEVFAPLAEIPGVIVYSLQIGPDADQATPWVAQGKLVDLTPHIRDFADTAALISNLDLVVTIDTSVAHLAGALARPVWTLLHYAPDWRWMLERSDSPWYPTMRLFRQKQPGDWQGVMVEVKKALQEMLP